MVGTADDAAVVLDPPEAAVVAGDFAVVEDDESLLSLLEQAVNSNPTHSAVAAMLTCFFIISPVVIVKCSGEQIGDQSECSQNEHRCSWQCFCARVAEFGVSANCKNEIGD